MSLFPDMPPAPRPTELTEEIKPRVIKAINQLLAGWQNGALSDESVGKYIYKKHLFTWSGFEIAKDLDDKFGVVPDTQLCDLLDDIPSIRREFIDKLVVHWVAQEHIEPKHVIGDTVTVTIQSSNQGGGTYTGTIYDISREKALYTVNIPALGHVARGEIGTQGRVFNFEDVL